MRSTSALNQEPQSNILRCTGHGREDEALEQLLHIHQFHNRPFFIVTMGEEPALRFVPIWNILR